MAFKNEYIPPLKQETSEFLKKAREILRTGYSKYDMWTVDRERDMALLHRGGGHSMESHNHEYWSFIDSKGEYYLITKLLSETKTSPEEIAITRSFHYTKGDSDDIPDAQTIACIKEALCEWSRRHMFDLEAYKRCQLTLIDAHTGEEI